MRRLRLLARLLDRQLYHIYGNRFARAGALNQPIEAVLSTLDETPPAGDPADIHRLHRRCLELNETVTLRFEEKGADLGASIRYLALERAIRAVTHDEGPPRGPGLSPPPGQKL